jgi:hypothetical protein
MGQSVPIRLPTITRHELTHLARTNQLQPLLSGISDTQASVNPDVSPGGGAGMPSEETSARSAQENKNRTVKVDGVQGKAVVKEFQWPINENLPPGEITALEKILDEFRDVFAFDASELGIIEGETYHIKLTNETPIFKQQYRLSQSEKEILQEQMEERKAVNFIRTSTSEWAAPVTMPPKKDENGNWTLKRPCVDYRALNSRTPTDHYPLPTPEEIFDALADSTVFTTLDLRMGYHQIRIAEEDCCKTAFWCLDGLHEWTVVPFGLKNAPPFFQRVMDQTLVREKHCARCFIDDVIIFSRDLEYHKQHLRQVLGRLREKGVKCHPSKMRVGFPDVDYLGHKVVPSGTAPMTVKVEAIVKMPPPTNVLEPAKSCVRNC